MKDSHSVTKFNFLTQMHEERELKTYQNQLKLTGL